MAVDYNRQYVGARYVPKFFENPDGSWDWEKGFQYEPLTIVRYGENSYTSKKLVPDTVGSPNLYPEYWANTGNYNGFTNSLQEQVNRLQSELSDAQKNITSLQNDNITNKANITQLQEKVSNVNKRRFILISDSFGEGLINASTPGKGFIQKFSEAYPGQVYYDLTPRGARGFKAAYPYIQLYNTIVDSIDDPNSITDIFITGGTNENTNGLSSAIVQFISNAKRRTPNAIISISVMGTTVMKNSTVYAQYLDGCTIGGVNFIPALGQLMYNPDFISDGTHLTQQGYDFYYPYIVRAILTGNTSFRFNYVKTRPEGSDSPFGSINFTITDRVFEMYFNESYVTGVPTIYNNDNQNISSFSLYGLPLNNIENRIGGNGEIVGGTTGVVKGITGYYITGNKLTLNKKILNSVSETNFNYVFRPIKIQLAPQ